MNTDVPIIELRQYTLRSGRRDELISLFEKEFIEPQNALGARVLGTFRDLDDADRFVWLRGFKDMATRKDALEAFYGGPVWKSHRDAANATMIDSANVLLLRSAGLTASAGAHSLLRIAIHDLRGVAPAAFRDFFEKAIRPRVEAAGVSIRGTLVSDGLANNYPRLPVRDDTVFAWLTWFPDVAAEQRFAAHLTRDSGWRDGAPEGVLPALMSKAEVIRLSPTSRSPMK